MSIDFKKIIFVILAGGRSKRFGGGFKTFSLIHRKTILEMIIEKLKKNKIEILINANENHPKFNKTELPIITDKKKGFLGPLAGIHASIDKCINDYPNKEWVFTVPSDTPFLPSNLLDKFLSSYSSGIKILIARSNNRHHPVIAMWHVSLLKSLEKELKLKNSKIMYWVKKHRYKFVDFEDDQEKNFFNINTQDDLNNAKKINI